jgi:hypothetical protein
MNQPKIGLSLNHKGWGIAVSGQKRVNGDKGLLTLSGVWRGEESIARGTELRQVWLENRLSFKAMVAIVVLDLLWSDLEIPPVPDSAIIPAVQATWEPLQRNNHYLIAYQVLERGETLHLRVGAISTDEIGVWLEIIESAGIEPEGFIMQSQAVSASLFPLDKPVVFVNVMETMIEMGIAMSGVPVQLRTFPWNAQDWDEVKEAIAFSLHAWTMKNVDIPTELVILGIPVKKTNEALTGWEQFNLEIKTDEERFGGELSLIVADGASQISRSLELIWHPQIAGFEQRERMRMLLLSALAFVLFITGSFLFYRAHIRRVELENEWIRANLPLYRELNSIIAEDEHSMAKLSRQKSQWEKRNFYSFYLDHWNKVVPPGTVLSSWTMEDLRVLEISGRTPSMPKLLEKLSKDWIFCNLTISGPIYRNPKGWDEFRLSGRLSKGGGGRSENRAGE